MIAFKVTHNGKGAALAGAPDLSVLTALVTATGRLGPDSHGSVGKRDRYDVALEVGGLTNRGSKFRGEFVDWKRCHLKVGDVVTIEIVEAAAADAPIKRTPRTARRKDFLPLIRKSARRGRGRYVRKRKSGTRTNYV